jgi:hypothetical protein
LLCFTSKAFAAIFQYDFVGNYYDATNQTLSGTIAGMFQLDTAEQPVGPLASTSPLGPGYLFAVAHDSLTVNGVPLDTSPYSTGFGQSSAGEGAGIAYIIDGTRETVLNMFFSETIANPQVVQPVPASSLAVLEAAPWLPGNACTGSCLVVLSAFKQQEFVAEPRSILLFAGGLGGLLFTGRPRRQAPVGA